MAASFDFAGFISALPNVQDPLEALNELSTILSSLHISDRRNAIPSESFHVIFSCLDTDDEDQIKQSCVCLHLLLETVAPEYILTHFTEQLQQGLVHRDPTVKNLCLDQLSRVFASTPDLLINDREIFTEVVILLGDSTLTVAKKAEDLLVKIAENTNGLQMVFDHNTLQTFKLVSEKSETLRFRVYECMTRIACISPTALEHCHECGILQQMVEEVNHSADILLQLNAIELLKDLALSQHGLVYLDGQGVVGHMETLLANIGTNPLSGFLLPGLVKFFGNVANIMPKEVCGRFQTFTSMLFELADSSDPTLQTLAVETVGFIGSTSEGKVALDRQGEKMTHFCQVLPRMIKTADNEGKLRALITLASIISIKTAEQTEELLALTHRWFNALGSQSLETLQEMTEKPFTDLRCAALSVLAALALTPWGQTLLNTSPGFNEYILNRNTEQTKEGKEAKYGIVLILKDSPTTIDIFGRPYHLKLKQYANEGPFYVRTEAAVALEEAS